MSTDCRKIPWLSWHQPSLNWQFLGLYRVLVCAQLFWYEDKRSLHRTSKLQSIYWFRDAFDIFWRVGSNPRRQSKNIEMRNKTHIYELYDACFEYISEELRNNHLTLLLVMTMPYAWWFLWWEDCIEDFKWRCHFQFGVAFWRVVFERGIFWRAKSRLKGIETSILNTSSKSLPNARHITRRPTGVKAKDC